MSTGAAQAEVEEKRQLDQPPARPREPVAAADDPAGGRSWLNSKRSALAAVRTALRRVELTASWTRLISFFAAVAAWYPLASWPLLSASVTAVLAAVFVGAVVRHVRARTRREFIDRQITIIDESLSRFGGQITLIRPPVAAPFDKDRRYDLSPVLHHSERWSLTGQESDDLDFFSGPVGLCGLLNRASTEVGAMRLRDALMHPLLDVPRILERQRAVRWLEENVQPRIEMMAAAAVLRDKDPWYASLLEAIRTAERLPRPGLNRVLRVWSLASLLLTAAIMVVVALGQTAWFSTFIGLALVNGSIYACLRKSLNERIKPWKNVAVVAKGLLHACWQCDRNLPDDGDLGQLKQKVRAVAAADALPALSARVTWSDSGGMMHTFANVLYFYDLHVVSAILKPAVKYRGELLKAMSALADLEVLLGLACFAAEQPVRCYPQPADETVFAIKGGCHPLVPPERVVCNDVQLDAAVRMWVITGSNMSGKSTLLRMAGVNSVLAQLGTVATAASMRWCPVRLISDLQVRDNISNNESYFLAEVRHLRRMLQPNSGDFRVLGLMDEPYRGTNSAEQVAASLAVVEHLLTTGNLFMVATHEARVTDLATGRPAANYHFQEDLEPSGMVFDYKLRTGPATSRNALRVLEREGYPPELMRRAYEWLEQAATTPPRSGADS